MFTIKSFTIKSPKQYTRTPWKNGKGETIELAISQGGSLENFDWRLSIATVSEDGVFSDFSGLRRDLFLLSGDGIVLNHKTADNHEFSQKLDNALDVATFDGASTTYGQLIGGTITDFNLMTRQGSFVVITTSITAKQTVVLPESGLCFIYPTTADASLVAIDNADDVTELKAGYLLIAEHGLAGWQLNADNAIVIQLIATKD
ncbi:HutD/Ves family protein [Colwellia sp. MEBiC06753]